MWAEQTRERNPRSSQAGEKVGAEWDIFVGWWFLTLLNSRHLSVTLLILVAS